MEWGEGGGGGASVFAKARPSGAESKRKKRGREFKSEKVRSLFKNAL